MCEIKKSPTVDIKFDDLSYATNTGGKYTTVLGIFMLVTESDSVCSMCEYYRMYF